MFIIFGTMIIIMLYSMKITKNLNIDNDNDYLSKNNTYVIKGIFIICIFLSHINDYVSFDFFFDKLVILFLFYLSQLMVTMFLFYSGYGIYESIKNKGSNYIDLFPKRRIAFTFLNFAMAVTIYLSISFLIDVHYSLDNILFSYIGWQSIGNSSWYMFAIFTLYLFTYFSFKWLKDCSNEKMPLYFITLLVFIYIFVLTDIKPPRYTNTILCYILGMWYSYYKDSFHALLQNNNRLYSYLLGGTIFLFAVSAVLFLNYFINLKYLSILFYNFFSIIFCFLMLLITMKFSFDSSILRWLGMYLFWIYILQRIPMILLKRVNAIYNYPYVYIILCAFVTLFLAFLMNKVSMRIKETVFENKTNVFYDEIQNAEGD